MRKLLLRTLPIFCFFTTKCIAASSLNTDTPKIAHVIDGDISEWKADKFETDKETQVLYAVDHDAENIYLALKVPNQRTQMKMMMMGMNLYLDKKGKKREGTGIEFPIKKTSTDGGGFGAGRPAPGEAPDPKAMREKMTATMIFLKTFGFDDLEDKTMLITQPDGINISFGWDESNILFVEYQVPMKLLGKAADLKGKPIAVGWKINGMTQPSGNSSPDAGGGGRGGGGRGGGGGRPGNSGGQSTGIPSAEARDLASEQSFWTKYTLNF